MMSSGTAWIYLLIAGVLEVVWALGIKNTQGFTRLWPSVFVLIGMGISFYCLSQSVRVLPIGSAYAIWTGIGAAGTAIFGMMIFGEPFSVLRMVCVVLIVAGIVGLKLLTA